MPLAMDQPSPRQDRKMRRHRVVGGCQLAGDFARRQALWFVPDQKPEHVKSCGLRKSGKSRDGQYIVHISRLTDVTVAGQDIGRFATGMGGAAGRSGEAGRLGAAHLSQATGHGCRSFCDPQEIAGPTWRFVLNVAHVPVSVRDQAEPLSTSSTAGTPIRGARR